MCLWLDNLIPWSTGFPEKLTVSQLVNKSPSFYGNRWFITAFTSVRHLSLSWARSIQSKPPSHLCNIHFNIIPLSTSGFSKWPSLRFSHLNPLCPFLSPTPATCLAHLSNTNLVTRIIFGYVDIHTDKFALHFRFDCFFCAVPVMYFVYVRVYCAFVDYYVTWSRKGFLISMESAACFTTVKTVSAYSSRMFMRFYQTSRCSISSHRHENV